MTDALQALVALKRLYQMTQLLDWIARAEANGSVVREKFLAGEVERLGKLGKGWVDFEEAFKAVERADAWYQVLEARRTICPDWSVTFRLRERPPEADLLEGIGHHHFIKDGDCVYYFDFTSIYRAHAENERQEAETRIGRLREISDPIWELALGIESAQRQLWRAGYATMEWGNYLWFRKTRQVEGVREEDFKVPRKYSKLARLAQTAGYYTVEYIGCFQKYLDGGEGAGTVSSAEVGVPLLGAFEELMAIIKLHD